MNTAAATAGDATPARSLKEVWIVTIGHALTHWYPATFYILLPLIGKELGLTYTQIGLVMTCQAIAGAVSNIPGGMIVDTVGKKALLLAISLFWIGVPYFLIGFTHNYSMLLICVMLVGIAFAGKSHAFVLLIAVLGFFLYAVRAVLQAWMLDSAPKNMGGTAIGVMFGVQSLGAAIAPGVGGLLADEYGLIMAFYFMAATIIIANIFVFLTPAPKQTALS